MSAAVRLLAGENSFFFAADLPASVEKYLAFRYGPQLDSDVLKVAHHGSKGSLSPEFLGAVSPDISIISAGEGNRYGHPHKEVLDALEKLKIDILRTDTLGTIKISTDGSLLTVVK